MPDSFDWGAHTEYDGVTFDAAVNMRDNVYANNDKNSLGTVLYGFLGVLTSTDVFAIFSTV